MKHRFAARYQARQLKKKNGFVRALSVVGGIALLIAGAILMVIPGPGIPVLLVGGGLLAREFKWAATALDWLEERLTKVVRWLKRQWRQAPVPLRVVVVVFVAFVASASAYGAYRVVF